MKDKLKINRKLCLPPANFLNKEKMLENNLYAENPFFTWEEIMLLLKWKKVFIFIILAIIGSFMIGALILLIKLI